jgi:ligand-binding SRPBCC domain-containing protein
MKILFETNLNVPHTQIKAGFNRELFLYLSPPGVKVDLIRFDGCSPGHQVHLKIKSPLMQQEWVSLITAENESATEWSFVDEGKKLPFPLTKWRHHHRVISLGESSSKIVDDISFECVPGLTLLMYPLLWLSFSVRPGRYRKFFQG